MNEEIMFTAKEVENLMKECTLKSVAIVLDKLRAELEDNITHSPYIRSFMDCCRLRDDVTRIINKYKEDLNNEMQKGL